MKLRLTLSIVLIVPLMLTGACSAEHADEPAPAPDAAAAPAAPAAGPTATGTVVETMNAANYTYVRVNTDDGEIWAAANRFDVAVGDVVTVPLEMPMQDFHSDTLDRTFPMVYFASHILRDGETPQPAMPANHPPIAPAAAGPPGADEPIEPAEGGVTVADVWSNAARLAGTQVTVRGRVVKYNGGILGTNWIHIQDGSGSADDGSNDITVTTLGNAAVGDVVTATGTVVTDQDFGAGYSYKVMIKDADLIRD